MRRLSTLVFVVSVIIFCVFMYQKKIVKDQTGPVFSMDSNVIEISVKDNVDALLKGISAYDAYDGDVTNSIIVEAISPFTGTGHRVVSYVAFDSDNHVTHCKRELIYTDYTPPQYHLSKPLAFAMNTTNLLDGVTAVDCIDGDITKNIRVFSDEIDTAHVGEYSARFKVSNSSGGVSYLPVTIEIFDASVRYRRPQLKLSDYIIYIEKGSEFDETNYLSSVTINGTEYSFVEEDGTYGDDKGLKDASELTIDYDWVDISGHVDTDYTGCYEVKYSIEDTKNNSGTGTARLYVVVTEEGAQKDE